MMFAARCMKRHWFAAAARKQLLRSSWASTVVVCSARRQGAFARRGHLGAERAFHLEATARIVRAIEREATHRFWLRCSRKHQQARAEVAVKAALIAQRFAARYDGV